MTRAGLVVMALVAAGCAGEAAPASVDAARPPPGDAASALRSPFAASGGWGHPVSQPFGALGAVKRARFHTGIDLAAPCGTPVYAVAAGEVIDVERAGDARGGRYVVVRHGAGADTPGALYSRYDHLLSVEAALGPIAAGARLGLSGASGSPRGCHLHLALRRGAAPEAGYTSAAPPTLGYLDPAAQLGR